MWWTDRNAGRRGHSLMPKSVGAKIPPLGAHADKTTEEMNELRPHAKLFTPMSNWTWYIMEWDAETGECYGLVLGYEQEPGYFHLDEISEATALGGMILLVERDCFWEPQTLGEIKDAWEALPVGSQEGNDG